MKKVILFYAPIGKGTPPERIGGAEAGCLKTMAIYRDAGINPIHINRPVSRGGFVKYILGMLFAPIKLAFLCISHPNSVIHIVGFYHRTIGQEKLMVTIAKVLGHKVIYEPRNGSMVVSYYEGDKKYRNKIKYLLSKPDVVLCQGLEYVKFIKEKYGIERSYYPNYIMDEFVKPNNLDRGETIRIIYFGRVVPEKNVDVVIKSTALLKNAGLNVSLDIIGGYSEEYRSILDATIKAERLDGIVKFYGRKPFAFIADLLRKSHYYLFPSSEANEGHSNSLTEAMGCGVVPIVSTAGFNASICGNRELVAEDLKPETYAGIIIKIESEKLWKSYSEFCYNRVMDNYTQSIVKKKLISYVEPLFD